MPIVDTQQKTFYTTPCSLNKDNDPTPSENSILHEASNIENTNSLPYSVKTDSIKSRIYSFFTSGVTRITNSVDINSNESSHLVGLTIHPKLAGKFINNITFDGTGKITSINQNIKKGNYNALTKNSIKPLNETPQKTEDKIRTPGEAMIDIAGIIKLSEQIPQLKMELEDLLKSTWLDGTLSRQSLFNLVELIKIKVGDKPAIIQEINTITHTLEKDFFVTKRNDNYYGRLFETELSKYIIDNPCDNMKKVRNSISSFILDDFKNLSQVEQKCLCEHIANLMVRDPPAWRYNLSHANKFLITEKPTCFIEMMKFTEKYSIPLILSVAVKYIASTKGTVDLKNEASEVYSNKIQPQKQLINSFNACRNITTEAYGLLLPYQHCFPSKNESRVGRGIRPIDRYMRPTVGVDLTEHDAAALSSERTVGTGMSGSANILHFLFRRLLSQDEHFPIDDAKLATAAWLSYSGGHSFNEAYSVFGFMSSGNFKPLSFNTLKTTSDLSNKAISFAYNQVLEASIGLGG